MKLEPPGIYQTKVYSVTAGSKQTLQSEQRYENSLLLKQW